MSDYLHQSDDNPQYNISQRMIEGVAVGSMRVGAMTQIGHQTVMLPQSRPKLTGIPENIPFRGSGSFVGRQDALETLHRELRRTDRVSISAIAGMGGIGKTELVVQYVRQHLKDYPGGVCWLQARVESPVGQVVEYAQNTLMLEVPQERGGQPLTLLQQLEWCWQYWEPAGRVLLVLDDVTDLTPCRPIMLAPAERFCILLTTRRRALDPSFFELPLDVLSPDAALSLMERLVGNDRLTAEQSTAEALCEWLGYLPLGLELVGRYLAQDRGLSLAVMCDQLQAAHQPLDDESLEGDYPLMTAQRGVRAAFELSWQELDADAQDVARLLSLFAPAVIPWDLAIWAMQQLKGESYRIRSSRKQLDNLHLVQPVDTIADALKLHPLIREFLQGKLVSTAEPLMAQDDLRRAFTTVMVEMAQRIPPTPTQEMIQVLSLVIPHLAEVAQRFTESLDDDNMLWPFVGLGRFYMGQGLYTLAESWFQSCLSKTQERLGEEHWSVAASLNNLAAIYGLQGRYSDIEPLYIAALDMTKRLLGEEHPEVATCLNNLAGLYESQGRYHEAEPLYITALDMRKRLLGEEHPAIATSLNDLAVFYASQKRFDKAIPLLEQALLMSRRLLGESHPSTQRFYRSLEQVKAAWLGLRT